MFQTYYLLESQPHQVITKSRQTVFMKQTLAKYAAKLKSVVIYVTVIFFISSCTKGGCEGCAGCKPNDVETKSLEDLRVIEEQRKIAVRDSLRRDSLSRAEAKEREAREKKEKEKKKKQYASTRDVEPPDIEGTKVVEPKLISPSKISEATSELEDRLSPTIQAAARRMNVRGYVSLKLVINYTGVVKSVQIVHNDLDEAAVAAIRANAMAHRYPSWDKSVQETYTTGTLKFPF
jgi:Gram-negative bacterial TonB protein C-terminal